MSKGNIQDSTYISEFINVAQWKKARKSLIKGVVRGHSDKEQWLEAFGVLHTRITTRFLNPIDWILEKKYDCGEGFSIVALQCVLIEFLEAFYQGKIYTTSRQPREFEYNSSKQLFSDFLMNHEPFSKSFVTKANANGFFDNIRCGLLHEAATKETSKINNASGHDMIVDFESNDPSNMRIYRENFQKAIIEFINSYKSELLTSSELQINFIRKMDDICGIKHSYYFAYGSNMFPERLLERIGNYHKAFLSKLSGHKFTYNKKSIDGTAKANIEPSDNNNVHGVCYEIDQDAFEILNTFERGYDRRNITITTENGEETKAITYVSQSIDNKLSPSDEYTKLILDGAKHWELDSSYIKSYLDENKVLT